MTDLKNLIKTYRKTWVEKYPSEKPCLDQFEKFFNETKDAFYRETRPGHFTGSAIVVDESFNRVLLTLHKKLGLWLQLGGHADGDNDLAQVAQREVMEESGLYKTSFVDVGKFFNFATTEPILFDLDVHWIPTNPKESGHFHYDARFLLIAHEPHKSSLTEESEKLEWFAIEEAYRLTIEPSMHRQFDKVKLLRPLFSEQSLGNRPADLS